MACAVSSWSATTIIWESQYPSSDKGTPTNKYVTPTPADYTPDSYCESINDGTGHFKPGTLQVTSLVEYATDISSTIYNGWGLENDYYKNASVAYRVTCGNKITYNGILNFQVLNYVCKQTVSSCDGPSNLDKDPVVVDMSTYNPQTGTFGSQDLAVPFDTLFNLWNQRAVSYPPYTFTGTPGKLARPALLIHGLNDDFKVWGAKPVVDTIDNPSFRNAQVKGYLIGSLPDMLMRNQNLDTNWNHNGIYFFQAPGNWVHNGKDSSWIDVQPDWSTDSSASQSRALYGRIKAVLDDYFKATQGLDWTKIDSLQIDLVCHSQGGIAVREMLRGLQTAVGFPSGSANAANHIHKIVTVDTPHFGSPMAGSAANAVAKYPGLSTLISDLDNLAQGDTSDRQLLKMHIDVDTWTKVENGANSGLTGGLDLVSNGTMRGILGIVTGPVGALFGATAGPFADVYFEMHGPYLGPYKGTLVTNNLGPFDSKSAQHIPDKIAGARALIQRTRQSAKDLDPTSDFITQLTGTNGSGFPTRPDGKKIVTLPLYSDSTQAFVSALLGQIAGGADKFCDASSSTQPGCLAVGNLLRTYASQGIGYPVDGVTVNDSLLSMLQSIQTDWLPTSDLVVEASSQTMVNKAAGLDTASSTLKPFFQIPHKYLIHNSQAPWEPVLHGPVKFAADVKSLDIDVSTDNPGAPRLGQDLLCALNESCETSIGSGNGKALLRISATTGSATIPALGTNTGLNVATQSLALTGDFNVQPVIASAGYHGVGIRNADSSFRLVAGYQPGYGAYVWYIDDAGTAKATMLTPGDIMANVSVARQGNQVIVTARNYSGKSWADTLKLTLPPVITYAVLGDVGSIPAAMLAGTGTATDTSTQRAPTPPVNNIWGAQAPMTAPIVVLYREARNVGDTATSRPRLLVRNVSGKPIHGFKVAFYFTGDSARNPMVEFDYPHASFTQEHLGGDQWRFVIDASQVTLDTGVYYPNNDGWQIRLHYTDWTQWNHWRDYSADKNAGQIELDQKIVVYANDGTILWGKEPTLPIDVTSLTEAGTIQVKDAAPWDTHSFKPQFTIQNTGTAPLANYHALYYFNVPDGKTLLMPAKNWSAKDASLSVNQVKGNLWALDVYFNKYILYPGQTIVEGDMGINLVDWSDFDKTQVGLILVDAKIKFLAGIVPSLQAYSSSSSSSSLPSSSSSSSVVTSSQLQVQIEDQSDVNYLRPRIKVLNQGSTSVSAFDLSFRFTSENGWIPLFDATWYAPNCSTAMNSFGNGLYSIDLHCTNLTLVPGSVWPNDGGATFGVHYGDWANWDKSNDPSMQGVTSAWTISTTTPITNLVSP